jgi:hypothetical protein
MLYFSDKLGKTSTSFHHSGFSHSTLVKDVDKNVISGKKLAF